MCSYADARDLRERAFLRASAYYGIPLGLDGLRRKRVLREARVLFSNIPISERGYSQHPALHPVLQDLADIIALEAADAFLAEYYPGIPEVRVSEQHVKRVMAAMQGEVDREASRRGQTPCAFASLPWERQQALAERRRYWFGVYGITPRTWHKGTWSVFKVQSIPIDGTPLAGRLITL